MQRVEQHVISRGDPLYAVIDEAAFKSKNLYNAAIMYAIINPMWVNVKAMRNLRDRQCPFNSPGMGLRTFLKESVLEPHDFDGAGQDGRSQGRPIPQIR